MMSKRFPRKSVRYITIYQESGRWLSSTRGKQATIKWFLRKADKGQIKHKKTKDGRVIIMKIEDERTIFEGKQMIHEQKSRKSERRKNDFWKRRMIIDQLSRNVNDKQEIFRKNRSWLIDFWEKRAIHQQF